MVILFVLFPGAPVSNARLRYHSQVAAAEHETALAGIL